MNVPEAEKLLGGYATGTLTPAERDSLLAASLHNQTLFDALADEEALRELLADPAARRRLAAALAPLPETLWHRLASALWRPLPMAAAAGLAAAAIAVVLIQRPIPPAQVVQVRSTVSTPPAPAENPTSAVEPPALQAVPQLAKKISSKDAPVLQSALQDAKEMNKPAPAPAPASPPPPALAAGQAGAVAVGALERRDESKAAALGEVQAKEKRAAAEADESPRVGEEAAAAPFRWEVQRLDEGGAYRAAPNPATLRAGDSIRLFVEARQAGRLVVLQQAGTPATEIFTRQVKPGDRILVPPNGSLLSSAGQRELVVMLESAEQLRARANSSFRAQAIPNAPGARQAPGAVRIRLTFIE